jgi:DNA-binding response OmpR family regulator
LPKTIATSTSITDSGGVTDVDQAANQRGLNLAFANNYDGIILDVLLPGKTVSKSAARFATMEQGSTLMLTALDAVRHQSQASMPAPTTT